ncbi:MAG: hypothetical protein Q7W30_08495 [Coriobacteriia bacterium]|nr:hypothetical protein [Coriobacteriia bacterium]
MAAIRRYAMPLTLMIAFAVHAGLVGVVAGRTYAPALTFAYALGACVVCLVAAGRPIVAAGALSASARLQAALGGALCIFAAPALVASNRLSDAPSGSVLVFWTTAGWAAVLGVVAIYGAVRSRDLPRATRGLAATAAILVGSVGILANWERPSSFSPLVKFVSMEMGILAAGVAFVAGGLLLVSAAREGRSSGALAIGGVTSAACALAFMFAGGVGRSIAVLGEQPVTLAVVGLTWGLLIVAWTSVTASEGAAAAAGCMAVAPILVSALTWFEQMIGAAGPQPMILAGVGAGALLAAAGATRFLRGGGTEEAAVPRRAVIGLSALPLALAIVGLALPAIDAVVTAQRSTGGAFSVAWVLPGTESVGVLAAVALAVLLISVVLDRGPAIDAGVLLAAAIAWPALLDVPTHVLVSWIPPDIQQDYGTEYATIVFERILNVPALAAVVLVAVGSLAVIVTRNRTRSAQAHRSEIGGS